MGLNDAVSHLLHSFLGSVSAVLILLHSSMYDWTTCTVRRCVCVWVWV